jgi:hypothetical protein
MPTWSRVAPVLAVSALLGAAPAAAQVAGQVDAGQVKVATGTVHVERGSHRLPALAGMKVRQGDVIVTGADGSVGVTFADNTLISAGPGSTFSIDRFAFDPTTHAGGFDASLRRGTLAAISGKLAKQSPDAMRVRTPAAILGVRGTEFVVRVADLE